LCGTGNSYVLEIGATNHVIGAPERFFDPVNLKLL
jgi:hypothetical protein